MRRGPLMTILAAILSLGAAPGIAAERAVVYAVNYPLQYFAQRIAGDRAEVVLPVPHEVDPAFWQPDAAAVVGFQRADLILLNGAGYAKWVSRASLPRRKLRDTSTGFNDRYIEMDSGATHSHGREGAHSHAGTAFTTWLDLGQAVEQARAVRNALAGLMPDQAETLDKNFLALERDLLDLDDRLRAIVARDPARPLLASHPVYQYLARAYSLNLASLLWEPDAMPPEAEWRALAELRAKHPADWMLWEGEPLVETTQKLQAMGIRSIVFDPCGNRPREGDFMTVMRQNIRSLGRIYGVR